MLLNEEKNPIYLCLNCFNRIFSGAKYYCVGGMAAGENEMKNEGQCRGKNQNRKERKEKNCIKNGVKCLKIASLCVINVKTIEIHNISPGYFELPTLLKAVARLETTSTSSTSSSLFSDSDSFAKFTLEMVHQERKLMETLNYPFSKAYCMPKK